ncbi:hypothetical protein PHYBLDRAFT_67631 [Phycomyces blakesleeanus NRRL 1555(-)]|uniref:Uncharacterized protein n=1 Tax=Phycomyces blakesleeanus (strain ATCC 8743b / DSM 1359 / FGSC 10004 / NBRC 33097 / NRRL 1555) TaxID=763407 RepID=A0A162UE59_PHYB8|nr:hypothetical protein PHYBLDRAFT_67631 [Phycomyces blakesleeanus NRRL 1555(-)]OAD74443.1 hypothetical protein PHYBLDRAFT_67631 [Phycomyces blakesleeanus NRRL 1555(-)]|eukprot:XP_018292483.1 hypothetical protein PHYBLDRAFT_67631 [Phycomyces blakesleeanus NRRL 1555(-)]
MRDSNPQYSMCPKLLCLTARQDKACSFSSSDTFFPSCALSLETAKMIFSLQTFSMHALGHLYLYLEEKENETYRSKSRFSIFGPSSWLPVPKKKAWMCNTVAMSKTMQSPY